MTHAQTRPSEPDLPAVALNAAIELDDLGLGRDVPLRAVPQLLHELGAGATTQASAGTPSYLLDLGTVVLVNRAIGETSHGQVLLTQQEVASHLTVILEQLEKLMAGDRNAHALTALKQFCLALAKHAADSRAPFEDLPSNPWRR